MPRCEPTHPSCLGTPEPTGLAWGTLGAPSGASAQTRPRRDGSNRPTPGLLLRRPHPPSTRAPLGLPGAAKGPGSPGRHGLSFLPGAPLCSKPRPICRPAPARHQGLRPRLARGRPASPGSEQASSGHQGNRHPPLCWPRLWPVPGAVCRAGTWPDSVHCLPWHVGTVIRPLPCDGLPVTREVTSTAGKLNSGHIQAGSFEGPRCWSVAASCVEPSSCAQHPHPG